MIHANNGKLEWFGGNQDALNMYRMLVALTHTWDDLVDKDKDVKEEDISNAFMIALVYLPANPFYQKIQQQILPLWLMAMSAYNVANAFEKSKDEHGIEIAHNLRYATGHIVAFMVEACLSKNEAKKILPEVWKDIVFERFDDYRKEHLDAVL
jgi:hypothetical protein